MAAGGKAKQQELASADKDYDQAVAEVDAKPFTFRFGGESFTVDMNIDGGTVLTWMDEVRDQTSVIRFLRSVFGEDDWNRLKATRQPWSKYGVLFEDIMSAMVGQGNDSTPQAQS